MDYINRVELAGTVGACRLTQAGGQTVARMSVATTIVYRDSAGEQVMEAKISKGSCLHITGRLRCSRYTRPDGAEALAYEVVADTLREVR